MDLSAKDVRKVCEPKRDRIPSRREGGDRAEGRSEEAEWPIPRSARTAFGHLPTLMTLKYIETRGHLARPSHLCRYCEQREADILPLRDGRFEFRW